MLFVAMGLIVGVADFWRHAARSAKIEWRETERFFAPAPMPCSKDGGLNRVR